MGYHKVFIATTIIDQLSPIYLIYFSPRILIYVKIIMEETFIGYRSA